MENKSFGQNRVGILREGCQGQTKRTVVLNNNNSNNNNNNFLVTSLKLPPATRYMETKR